jgi:hypothetical protein
MTQPPRHLPACAGYLMMAEIKYLGGILAGPEAPFVAVLGGAKVSDKLPILESLAPRTNVLAIGGAMAYTFLKAKGEPIGKSLCEDDLVDTAKRVLDDCAAKGIEVILPVDHVVADAIDSTDTTTVDQIPADKAGFDVGPKTLGQDPHGPGVGENRALQRPGRRLRIGAVRGRHPRLVRSPGRVRRNHDRRRRRRRERRQGLRRRRQDDPRQHRRRRQPRTAGRQ